VPEDWPVGDLRVTGVSISSGKRVTWDAGSDVPLRLAVAASCSVPGLFPPVTLDGDRYTDGGLWSGSNADLLLGEGCDAVVFAGPMAGDTGIGRVAARSIERELDALAATGTATHALLPRVPFAGTSLMDPLQREPAYAAGFADGRAAAATVAALIA
jgi:NTE family protein